MNNNELTIKFVADAITEEIKKLAEKEYDKMKVELLARLEKEKSLYVSGVALNITKMIDFQSAGDRLIITLKTK